MENTRTTCPYCGVSRCRTSHFRLSDLPYLALMKLPVRCDSCQVRFHVGHRMAFQIAHAQQSRSSLVLEAEHRLRQQRSNSAVEDEKSEG
jgi:C4-type Zn-finger protein